MIRLAQLYTGFVGSEILRRLAGHRELQLVAVLVHSAEKAGKDSGVLAGADPNGIITTQSVDDVIATRPDAAIYSGLRWDVDLVAQFLRAGINVYNPGVGGFYLRGMPEFDVLDAAGKEGNASFTSGGNIPGLIGDVFPLFLSGYTGKIRAIRATQRNDVSTYPSAVQVQQGLGIGLPPPDDLTPSGIRAGVLRSVSQMANLVADGLGIECTKVEPLGTRIALAQEDFVLPGSGLLVRAGTVAGTEWTAAAYSGDRQFLTVSNQQNAALGLGPGWRETYDEPPWRVEIDGEPPIVATFGWPQTVTPQSGAETHLLNVSRAMNSISRLVAAPPGCVSVLDYPVVVANDGLAPA